MKLLLDTVIIFVRDIEKMKTFYTGILQFAVEEEIPGEWVLLRSGNAKIGLHKMGEAFLEKSKENFTTGNNIKIVFETTENIDLLQKQLLELNVPVAAVATFDGYDYWICDGKDPERNVFQLKQKK